MRKLEAGPSVRVGRWSVLPIELTVIDGYESSSFHCVSATKSLHALVLVGGGTRRAFDSEGNTLAIRDLLENVPALANALASA